MANKAPKPSKTSSEIRGLVVEAEFTEISPSSSEEVETLMSDLEAGNKTIAQVVKEAGPGARRKIESLLERYELPEDLTRRLRKAVINQSLVEPQSRPEALAAVRLAQAEETIIAPQKGGGLSDELLSAAEEVMKGKRLEAAKARESIEAGDQKKALLDTPKTSEPDQPSPAEPTE